MYHTLHDTVYWMEHYVDREYKFHLTVAKVVAYYVLYLANTPLVPFDLQRYSDEIQHGVVDIAMLLHDKNSDKAGCKNRYVKEKNIDFLIKNDSECLLYGIC